VPVSQSMHSFACLPRNDNVTSPPVDDPSGKNWKPPSDGAERIPEANVNLASMLGANERRETTVDPNVRRSTSIVSVVWVLRVIAADHVTRSAAASSLAAISRRTPSDPLQRSGPAKLAVNARIASTISISISVNPASPIQLLLLFVLIAQPGR
jgi:hypothetical protein